jgi:hypothetical protein
MTPRGPIGREPAGSPAVNRTGFLGSSFSSSGHPHGPPTPGSATYQGGARPAAPAVPVPAGHRSYSSGPPHLSAPLVGNLAVNRARDERLRPDRFGARVALEQPQEDLTAANARSPTQNGSAAAARRFGSSTAFRLSERQEAGRCSSTSPRSGSTASRSPIACSRRRSPPRRCVPGRQIADRHVRSVFSNEPVERLALLGDRVRRALAAAS